MSALGLATRLEAQVAASATVGSDYRYRGVSLSGGKPALSLDLSYDAAGGGGAGAADGVYVGGSLIAGSGLDRAGPVLDHLEYIGYAHALGANRVLDVGVSHAAFARQPGGGVADSAEIYAGVRLGSVSAYLHYSPDYFGSGLRTLYADGQAGLRVARRWRLFAHVGALTPLGGGAALYPGRERYDAGAGVAAQLPRGELRLSWVTARPDPYADASGGPDRDAVVLEASWFF